MDSQHTLALSKRLREARIENRLKQEQVAHYLRIPVSAVSAFEAGRRKVDATELFMLSKLYQRPMNWFFGDCEEKLISEKAHRRWYDGNPLVGECLTMLERAPQSIQRSALNGIIGFLGQS